MGQLVRIEHVKKVEEGAIDWTTPINICTC